MARTFGRIVFAAMFIAGGVGHFAMPDVYLRIMPAYLPEPRALVWISGAAELAMGVMLLVRPTRKFAAWGLIALLIAVFPANLFMWQHSERFPVPPWALLLRLPVQGLLIAWAWAYTRPAVSSAETRSRGSSTMASMLAMVAIAGMVGCGMGGASLGRLTKGATARTQSPEGKPIVVYFAASEETLPPDTVVKVVSDDEGSIDQADRKVLVGFAEGPHQGLAAFVRRSDLEPDR